jgi:hypothetical protein
MNRKFVGFGWFATAVVLVACPVIASAQGQGQQGQGQQGSDQGQGLPQVQFINQQIATVWQDYGITPSAAATDGEWCRRLYLDVLGRIPSVQELNEFVSSTDPQKREKLVESLLYDEQYTEEYARNWTSIWTNVLIGRAGGTERNTLTSREGMQKYLRDSFARNKPYDKLVYELVTAVGTTKPGSEKFNGAANYLAMKVNEEDGTLATSDTARIFLGLQVQCTQCHNHPFNDWKQQKYWEMNAFFRQTRALRRYVPGTRDVDYAELVNQDFGGEGSPQTPENAEIYYELRNGETKVAYPVFVDGASIGTSGFVEDVIRREELAKMMLKSEYLDKAAANRLWAHFLGYGFTKPIDDLGPHNASSHPALLEYLGQEFRKSNYNLKELTRWIVLSQAYGLSSRFSANNKVDDPQLGETPKFSHFYLRQMRAEELFESLIVATEAQKTSGGYEEQEKAKTEWLRQFVIAFGTDEGDEATTFNGTIPQALMMFNGDLVKKATSSDKGSFLWKVANDASKPNEKVEYLFLAAVGRKPSREEVGATSVLYRAHKGDMMATLQDMWWAVLNSNEFIFNH